MHEITHDDIDAIALGAAVLGTGGGGSPHVGALIAKRLLREHGPVRLVQVTDLADDDVVAPIGAIGSPSVSIERIQSEAELLAALHASARAVGLEPTAIMPIEVGGGNSMIPIATAALAGLPVVDGDAMGRAFPESQMVTFHLAGYAPGPAVLADYQGNVVTVRAASGEWSERFARAITVEMGGSTTMVDYVHPGAVVRECAIPGTLTLAKRIGAILHGVDGAGRAIRDDERITALCADLGAFRLFDGKVTDLQHSVVGGFTRGAAQLEGVASHRGSTFTLEFQNEMLLARRDGQLAAVTPDLIVVLDLATGMPITTESLRYGARVAVIGLPCNERWRTEIGLRTAGPGYFGYDVEWIPVERLNASNNMEVVA